MAVPLSSHGQIYPQIKQPRFCECCVADLGWKIFYIIVLGSYTVPRLYLAWTLEESVIWGQLFQELIGLGCMSLLIYAVHIQKSKLFWPILIYNVFLVAVELVVTIGCIIYLNGATTSAEALLNKIYKFYRFSHLPLIWNLPPQRIQVAAPQNINADDDYTDLYEIYEVEPLTLSPDARNDTVNTADSAILGLLGNVFNVTEGFVVGLMLTGSLVTIIFVILFTYMLNNYRSYVKRQRR